MRPSGDIDHWNLLITASPNRLTSISKGICPTSTVKTTCGITDRECPGRGKSFAPMDQESRCAGALRYGADSMDFRTKNGVGPPALERTHAAEDGR